MDDVPVQASSLMQSKFRDSLGLLVEAWLSIHGVVIMNENLLLVLPDLYLCVFFVLLQRA